MDSLQPEAPSAPSVHAQARKGFLALASRSLFSQVLRVLSSLCLSRLLFPADYGLFGIISYSASLGVFVGDLGLSAALVRQQREPTARELSTLFWFHQLLTALVVAVLLAWIPSVTRSYHLGAQATPMMYALSVGLFFSSLRATPLMTLERKLAFPRIARLEFIETIVQALATIGLAALGVGAWALVLGGLTRNLVGLSLVWKEAQWRPIRALDFSMVRRLVGFGFAFQLPPLVGAMAAGWVPLVVGRELGKDAVGLVNWAWALASTPMVLSAVLNRVTFPTYCRIQEGPEGIATTLRLSLRRLTAVLLVMGPLVIFAVPVAIPLLFGHRWNGAVSLVQWFSLECILATLTGLLATTQNASGHPYERLGVTITMGGLKWLVGTWLIHRYGLSAIGPMGVSLAMLELWGTAYLVARRAPAFKGLVIDLMEPLVSTGSLLALTLVVGRLVGFTLPLGQALLASLLFTLLLLGRERIPGTVSFVSELRQLVQMLRTSRNRAVSAPGAS